MASLLRELKKVLHESGCYLVRQGKGDHEIWFSPINNKNFTVDNGLNYRHLANVVLKDAGLPKQF
jgi:HicA toxin of bacterial toxin-antitoxin,